MNILLELYFFFQSFISPSSMILAWIVEVRVGAERVVGQAQRCQAASQKPGLLQARNIQVKDPQVFVPL